DRTGALSGMFSHPHPPQRFYRKAWRTSVGVRKDLLMKKTWEEQDRAIQELRQAMRSRSESKNGSVNQAQMLESLDTSGRSSLPSLGEMPAGSLTLARLRQDFRETATWQPQLRTGTDGIVRTTFRLPDSLTPYRLTAVALTKNTKL